MPGKIDAYNLGDLGVDLVSSPLHSDDGTLLLAQNVIVEPVGGQHAIAKRPGHTKLTPTAAAGALLAICPIPFFDPSYFSFTGTFLYRREDSSNLRRTADGTSWSQSNFSNYMGGQLYTRGCVPLVINGVSQERLYYAINSLGTLTVGYFPSGSGVILSGSSGLFQGLWPVSETEIYVCSSKTVRVIDDTSETVISPNPFDGLYIYPCCPIELNGDVFVGSQTLGGDPSGKIYRYVSGTTWAVDASRSVVNNLQAFTVYRGRLFACMSVSPTATDANIDKILVRSSDGTWTSLLDTSGSFYAITTYNDRLFVGRKAAAATEIHTSADNGVTWTLDEDLTATFGVAATEVDLFAFEGFLYCAVNNDSVFRRDSAGTWTEVDTAPSTGAFLGAY